MDAVRTTGCCTPGTELLALVGEAMDAHLSRKDRRAVMAYLTEAVAEPAVIPINGCKARAERAELRALALRFIGDRLAA